jgi:hypothetical protein
MHFAIPNAPWIFPTWKDITGVRHGLFPEDDDKLPPGWTRQKAEAVASYFDQYNKVKTEDEKIKFASVRKRKNFTDPIEGRTFFHEWVTSHYSSIWKIHNFITKALNDCQVHPLQIMMSNGDLSTCPSNATYLPYALDQAGLVLFGKEALDKNGHLLLPLRDSMLVILQRTWENSKKQIARDRNSLIRLQSKAVEAFEGEHTIADAAHEFV